MLPEKEKEKKNQRLLLNDNNNIPEEPSSNHIQLFDRPAKGITLDLNILDRIGDAVKYISTTNNQDWFLVTNAIYKNGGLTGINIESISFLIQNIPLADRYKCFPLIDKMREEAGIKCSKIYYDMAMSTYAEIGNSQKVEEYFEKMLTNPMNFKPTVHTFGHLIKSYLKTRDLESASKALNKMKTMGIKPNKHIYTELLQTCSVVGDYKQANKIFDMMKFLSLDYAPDTKTYTSMIYAAGENYQAERALDLFKEMANRSLNPLSPNIEVYHALIYSLSKIPDFKFQQMAWQIILQIHENGLEITKETFEVIMFLCAETGEITFSRIIFRKMCENQLTWPDSKSFSSLLVSYSNFKKLNNDKENSTISISPIMGTEIGQRLKTNFLLDSTFELDLEFGNNNMPPFLPLKMLSTQQQILAESRAIFEFIQERKPNMINEIIVGSYLQIPAQFGDIEEFKRRYEALTYLDSDEKGTVEIIPPENEPKVNEPDLENSNLGISETNKLLTTPSSSALKRKFRRNDKIYISAILACSKSHDIKFAKDIWIERGQMRRTSHFKNKDKKEKDKLDFDFTIVMIKFFTECNLIQDAVSLLKSTKKQFPWRFTHLRDLYIKAAQIEDRSIKFLIKDATGFSARFPTNSRYRS